MISLEELIKEIRNDPNKKLCTAIESDKSLCFNEVHSKNLCIKHYQRQKRLGTINLPEKKAKRCKLIDCKNPHKAKGYCLSHYKQYVKTTKKCTVNDCIKNVHAKNLCRMHYERYMRHGDVNGKSSYQPKFPKEHKRFIPPRININCIVLGCSKNYTNDVIRKGLCKNHYYKWHKYGDYNYQHNRSDYRDNQT